MQDESRGKIITKFFRQISEPYSYLKDNSDEGKKTKGSKSVF